MTGYTKKCLILAAFVGILGASVQGAYQYGDTGSEIVAIQKKLIAAGYKARETGEYDANTKWAVRLYQKDQGLPVDGILGDATYKKLMGKPMPSATKTVSKVKEISKKDAELMAKIQAKKEGNSKAITTSVKQQKKPTTQGKPATVQVKHKVTNHTAKPLRTVPVSGNVKEILTYANTFTGVPYKFGGTTPAGFDCSGYIRHVFQKVGVQLPRQADEQYTVGKKVEKQNLQPGDLVFFETYEPGVSHSGIYIGDGQFISATSSSGVAVADIDDSYWGPRYVGAKRVL
ncbi:NlpC/P60 family protein [Veillonella sp. CHU740]|uniref:C40 family peptidase n=1 Tax=Veillonella sp. CHU740 TaxID=2490950 RepID=UPI000F8CFBBE|nr:NlpC/P60 family protein [Veillonella sp. CHU740]